MLIFTRRVGDAVQVGDNITITVKEIRRRKCKLVIDAPKGVEVRRGELPKECGEK